MDLSGKVLAVTGSDGALGRAVVAVLSAYGARVALISRSQAPSSSSGAALPFGGVDLTLADAARSVMERIVSKAGRLDGLINLAGGFQLEKLAGGTLDSWNAMYKLNLMTAVNACQAALPYLVQSRGGRIVNVGAMGAVQAAAGMGPYAASKAGVAQLTEALAAEMKEHGVTVNAILPSTLDTPKNRLDMPQADFTRWVAPAEAAQVIAFLVSDQASAVTGALIPVAGRV